MKRVILILGCFSILTIDLRCSVKDADNQNVTLSRSMFEAFNAHDWSKMTSFYRESAMFLDPSYGTEYVAKTRQEIIAKYTELQKMFPDVHDEIVGIYPAGDRVTVEFISTGTISDSLSFRLPIITVLTFEDGLIVKDATYYDLENP
jgi:ketosteroid isomerase-like protein